MRNSQTAALASVYRQKSANASTTPARLAVSSTGPSPSHDALDPKQASLHPASGPLRREQIDALLEELRDPALARQFLMDAGLIDADGQLTPPYRSQDARSA